MKLTKKAKIAILKGKVAKLKFQLKQAREKLALQDSQLDRFRTINQDLPTTERGESKKPKALGIVSHTNGDKVLYVAKDENGKLDFTIYKSMADRFESLQEFFSKHPVTKGVKKYKFEPIESEENINIQINEQTR